MGKESKERKKNIDRDNNNSTIHTKSHHKHTKPNRRNSKNNNKKNYKANSTTQNHFAKRNQTAMSMNSAAEAARNSGDYDNGETMAASRSAELLAAASEGRGDEVVRILEADPELLRVGDPVGDTALHVLARARHVDALRQLIRFLRSKPNYKELLSTVAKQGNGHGDTPLHLASKNRHREAAYLLCRAEWTALSIRNDDDESFWTLMEYYEVQTSSEDEILPDEIDEDKPANWYDKVLTPMGYKTRYLSSLADVEMGVEWAKLKDHMVEMLGSDPKLIQTKSKKTGNTIFQDAAYSGNMDMLTNLVRLAPGESSLLDTNDRGDTALHLALDRKHTTAARYLIELAPEAAYKVNKLGLSPLSLALMLGEHDLVKYVLQVMPEASIPPATRYALLAPHKGSLPHTAIRARTLTMLRMTLESIPCLIDSPDEKGWKPLSYAAYKGYLKEVRYLLGKFPESKKRFDGDGSLPIHKAVSGGHISIIKEFILSHPRSLYAIDKKGRSVLHIAVRYAKADILKYLIHEADGIQNIRDLRDHEGKTFEDYAKELKRN